MFSPNYLFLGISGFGVTGASLMAWWIISGNRETKLDIQEEIKKKCGDDVWLNLEGMSDRNHQDRSKENNDKGMNMSQYATCVTKYNNEITHKTNSSKSTNQA